MPTTNVLDADELARQRFEERVREAMPVGVPRPAMKRQLDAVNEAALEVVVQAAVNRAKGSEPTYRDIDSHPRNSGAAHELSEARAAHWEEVRPLAQKWLAWIEEVDAIPEEDRLPDALPEPPADPSDMLDGARRWYQKKHRQRGSGRWTDAASLVCWRLAQAAAISE